MFLLIVEFWNRIPSTCILNRPNQQTNQPKTKHPVSFMIFHFVFFFSSLASNILSMPSVQPNESSTLNHTNTNNHGTDYIFKKVSKTTNIWIKQTSYSTIHSHDSFVDNFFRFFCKFTYETNSNSKEKKKIEQTQWIHICMKIIKKKTNLFTN